MMKQRYIHICEVCGKRSVLTPKEAYEDGWDYPPLMGMFGVISPRKCGKCPIEETLYWVLAAEKNQSMSLARIKKKHS